MALRHGVNVLGFSSDGDPRLLAAMRHQMQYSSMQMNFMQDPTHHGLKLRNRLLRLHAALPMGTKLVSVSHLKLLMNEVPKAVHGLVYSDISPNDKQNFKALEKCMGIRTREALRKYVPDSEATELFLKICWEVTSSLMDYDITPYERIEMIFHATYFLRIWRNWISKSNYSLQENFITANAYICAELNAENLLSLTRKFRDENKPEFFLTNLFDSQACERAFRQLRSMGTPNFTKINFTLLEVVHMIRRLEVQNEIVYSKLANMDIKFPKLDKKCNKIKIYALPTEEEIDQCLRRAKRFAIDDALQFGMNIDSDEIEVCDYPIPKQLVDDEAYGSEDDIDMELELPSELHGNEEADFADDDEFYANIDEDMKKTFVSVKDHTGVERLLRKSTLVWILSDGTKKISSDRLLRVACPKSFPTHSSNSLDSNNEKASEKVYVSNNINIGEWCFFKIDLSGNEMICIGQIHAFKFTKGRIAKDKIYKHDNVNFSEENLVNELDVLSTWYLVNDKAILVPTNSENHYFVSLRKYVATVSVKPLVDVDTRALFFHQDDFPEIDDALLKLVNSNNFDNNH